MIYKRCLRCGKRIEAGQTCECVKQRHKEYNKYSRNKISSEFYDSVNWKRIREYIKNKYDGIDVYAYVVFGQIEQATLVHHIVEIEDDKSQALVERNLIPVSLSSHNLIHQAYNESKASKQAMQATLYECLRRMDC